MKVTKIYDFRNEFLDTPEDKVKIEMSSDEYTMLTGVIELSKLYTDIKGLAEDCDKILKLLNANTEIKIKE